MKIIYLLKSYRSCLVTELPIKIKIVYRFKNQMSECKELYSSNVNNKGVDYRKPWSIPNF